MREAVQRPSPFLWLPSEVIERVLTDPSLPPEQVAAVAACCRSLHHLIYAPSDTHLWRTLFLNHFDDPRALPEWAWGGKQPIAWKELYAKRVRAVGIVKSGGLKAGGRWDRTYWSSKPKPRLRFDANWRSRLDALDVICEIAASSLAPTTTEPDSLNADLLESQVLPSAVSFAAPDSAYHLRDLRSDANVVNIHSAIDARLLVYLGCDVRPERCKEAFLQWQRTVFHLSTYRGLPEFGPFTADGEVHWSLIAALQMVMVTFCWELQHYDPDDASEVAEVHRGIRVGPRYVRRGTQIGWLDRAPGDWAGVTGLWTGTYTFVDHSDFIEFNEPGSVTDDALRGATGGKIHMHLNLVPALPASASLPTLDPALFPADRPPLYFRGTSLSQGFEVGVYGSVAFTKGSHLQWRFVVYYGGADRWQLEGMQVHEGARMGIIGVWSPADDDPRGPVGPFWYWKADDDTSAQVLAAIGTAL